VRTENKENKEKKIILDVAVLAVDKMPVKAALAVPVAAALVPAWNPRKLRCKGKALVTV
jgi:hypothetical protein